MKITDIDIIPAHVPLAARNAEHAVRFRSIDQRTFFKVQTDNGLVGLGRIPLHTAARAERGGPHRAQPL